MTGACLSSLLSDRSTRERDSLPVDHGAGRGAAGGVARPVENPVTGS